MRADWFLLVLAMGVVFHAQPGFAEEAKPLNILLFTADDLHYESVGAFTNQPHDLTPNIDAFAKEGMRFTQAHVNVAICAPSRAVIATGLFSHHSGAYGFTQARPETPEVTTLFQKQGYLAGVLGKVGHSTPTTRVRWDYAFDQADLGRGRNPNRYFERTQTFFERCKREGKPFYLMVNSHDPHRPFCNPENMPSGTAMPSKTYQPKDVIVPKFLPDLPGVRKEISHYLNSVRRLDDTFGRVMEALRTSGMEDNTLVLFISDNGMAVPFAKCNAWYYSTRTPLIVRWPGNIQPNQVNIEALVSEVDFLPTFLEAAGLTLPDRLDGRSLVPLLKGEKQGGRDMVFTQIDTKVDGDAVPMRCVQTNQFAYIYNPFSDGTHRYRNANEGQTMRAMQRAAKGDAAIAERIQLFRFRVPEELYDTQKDPECLHNLVNEPEHQKTLETLRTQLSAWMERTEDPMLAAFEHREDRALIDKTIEATYSKGRAKRNRDE